MLRPRRSTGRGPLTVSAELFERRLLVVTGKGGVGKTTVALAVALAAAARGRRTVLCELTGHPHAARMLGVRDTRRSRPELLAPNLSTIAVDPERALEEWLARTIGRPGARLMSRSSTFGYFVAAAPGARELVTLGKAWDLVQPRRAQYDLAVLDAPSAGHAVALLSAPSTFAELVPAGPIARQAKAIQEFLESPHETGLVGVTLPTELAVSETLELDARLEQAIRRRFEVVIANQVLTRHFMESEVERVHTALSHERNAELRAAERATRSAYVRRAAQDVQLSRLRASVAVPVLEVPYVYRPTLGPADLRRIADGLDAALAGVHPPDRVRAAS